MANVPIFFLFQANYSKYFWILLQPNVYLKIYIQDIFSDTMPTRGIFYVYNYSLCLKVFILQLNFYSEMQKEKLLIGRREKVDFPELGLLGITAKIDTGAYTSALHCYDIKEKDGILYFKPLGPAHSEYTGQEQKFTTYTRKEIKNSFGEVEKRYIIKTVIKIGRKRIKAIISLTNRGKMRYPVLIGRKLLKNRFIVDVSQLDILSTKRVKKNIS